MRSALRRGRYSAGDGLHGLEGDDGEEQDGGSDAGRRGGGGAASGCLSARETEGVDGADGGEDAVEEQWHQFGGRERRGDDEHRVVGRRGPSPAAVCAAARGSRRRRAAVRLEQRGERLDVGADPPAASLLRSSTARPMPAAERTCQMPEARASRSSAVAAEPSLERERRVDGRQRGGERARVERRVERGLDQRLLVGEDAEDRPFRDAGGRERSPGW